MTKYVANASRLPLGEWEIMIYRNGKLVWMCHPGHEWTANQIRAEINMYITNDLVYKLEWDSV